MSKMIKCDQCGKLMYTDSREDKNEFAIVFYSDRLQIERAFNEWAEKYGVVKMPNALVAFLEINGLLNTEKTVKWCRARKQKRINDSFKGEG